MQALIGSGMNWRVLLARAGLIEHNSHLLLIRMQMGLLCMLYVLPVVSPGLGSVVLQCQAEQ